MAGLDTNVLVRWLVADDDHAAGIVRPARCTEYGVDRSVRRKRIVRFDRHGQRRSRLLCTQRRAGDNSPRTRSIRQMT